MRTLLLLVCAVMFICFIASAGNGKSELIPVGSPHSLLIEKYITSSSSPRPNDFTYTIPTGDNRCLFFVAMSENNGNFPDYPSSVTYGNQPLQLQTSTYLYTNTSPYKFVHLYVFILKEAGIMQATSDSFKVSYYQSTPHNTSSYATMVFTADDMNQQASLTFCETAQTGGNVNTPDSIACEDPSTYEYGNLKLNLGLCGKTNNTYPLHSNPGVAPLFNQESNNMVIGAFHKTVDSTHTETPYMVTNGGNAGRFILVALEVPATINPLYNTSLSFEARTHSNFNLISWSHQQESKVSRYVLQKSEDGKNFTQAFSLTQAYFSNDIYTFKDINPFTKTFYRLKVECKDGSSYYSNVLQLHNRLVTNVSVYPNPNSGKFTLYGDVDERTLIVYNMYGQKVPHICTKTNVGLIIHIPHYVPGVYHLSFKNNAYPFHKRLILK